MALNPEQKRLRDIEIAQRWREKNKEHCREYQRQYRAKRKAQDPAFYAKESTEKRRKGQLYKALRKVVIILNETGLLKGIELKETN